MSTTIDQRVVEMRFDNSHFEKNVSTTMSTLEKLKQKLNLSGAAKGLDEMNAAAKNNSMPILGSAVETVSAKFSALQVMGITALANITNSAVNAGKRIVKSLTIDPIKSGFEEYETKMGSIQTILANTEHQGTTLDDVKSALEELNLYADKTIYNFQQMTRNIGTFTAAGVDLRTSVDSIQGIANLAAVSGSTSQQASTAMYQLSQALASGTVKLMDWNSVVNAGMGGKVFQNALIRTAAMLDGSAEDVETWQKNHIDAYGSFRESLTKEQWLTTEVLTTTLRQFTMAAEEGSDEWNEFKKSLTSSGYTETQANEILKMANTATDAATKVKTFTQLMDTLKESAQSGWAQTWELVVGDFEEAKAFFTELSDIFGGIIGKSADRRNTFLGDAMMSNWDKLISKINDAGIETSKFEESIRKIVGDDELDNVIQEFGSLEKAVRSGAVSSDVLKKALSSISTTDADGKIANFVDGLKEIEQVLGRGDVGDDVEKLQNALKELGYGDDNFSVDGIIGPATEKAIKAFQEANGLLADGIAGPETLAALEKAGSKIEETTDNVEDLTGTFDDLVDVITKKSGRELLLDSLMNVIKTIQRPLEAVGEALRDVFSVSPNQLYNALNKINKFTKKLVPKGILDVETWEDLLQAVNKFGVSTNDFVDSLKNALKSHGVDVDELTEKYGSLGHAFEAGAISFDVIKESLLGFDGVTEALLNGGETVEKIRRSFEGLFAAVDIVATVLAGPFKFAFKMVTNVLSSMGLSILDVTARIGDAIVAFRDKVDSVVDTVTDFIANNVSVWIEKFKETEFFITVSGWFEGASNKIGTAIDSITNKIDNVDTSSFVQTLSSIGAVLKRLGSDFKESKLGSTVIGAISNAFTNLKDIFSNFPKFTSRDVGTVIDKLGSSNISSVSGFLSTLAGSFKSTVLGKVKKFFQNWQGITWDDFKFIAFNKFVEFWTNAGDKIKGAFEACKEFAESIKTFIFGTEDVTLSTILDMAEKILGIIVLIKALNLLNGLVVPFDNITRAINNFSSSLKWKAISSTFKSMALALAALTLCIVVITQLPDMGKAWQAAGMLAGLLIIMGGVALAMGYVSTLMQSGWSTAGVALSLLAMMISIVILVKVIQEIDGMELKDPSRTFSILAAALLALTIGLAVITRAAKAGFGAIAAVLTFVVALKQLLDVITLYSEFPWAGTQKGIKKMIEMLLMLSAALAISSLGGSGLSTGTAFTLIAMVLSLKILLNVIKEFAAIDDATLEKGGQAVLNLLGVMTLIAVALNLTNKGRVLEKGQRSVNSFTGLAGALLAVVIAVWALGTLATKHEDIFTKGMEAVTRILLLFAVTIGAIGLASKGLRTGVVVSMLVMFAVLLAELGIIIKVMEDVPWQNALGVLGGIALIMIAMSLVLKSMNGFTAGKGAIGNSVLAMAGLGAVMLLIATVLSIMQDVPWQSALASAAGMSLLILAMAYALSTLSKYDIYAGNLWNWVGAMAVMAIIIGGLGFVIASMQKVPWQSALGSAAALSILLITMSGVLFVLGHIKADPVNMATALAAFAVLGLVVWEVGAILRKLTKNGLDGNALGAVNSISAMLVTMTGVLAVCAALGLILQNPMVMAGLVVAVVALAALGLVVWEVGAIIRKLNSAGLDASAIGTVIVLSEMLTAMTKVLAVLTILGIFGGASVAGVAALALLGLVVWEIGAIVRKLSENGLGINSIGTVIVLCTILTALVDALKVLTVIGIFGVAAFAGTVILGLLALELGVAIWALSKIKDTETARANVETIILLLSSLTNMILLISLMGSDALAAADALTNLVGLVEQLSLFALAIGGLATLFGTGIEQSIARGLGILKIVAGGVGEMIGAFGEGLTDSLPTIAENLSGFANKLGDFVTVMNDVDDGIVDKATNLGKAITEITKGNILNDLSSAFGEGSSLPTLGEDLSKFASNASDFITAMDDVKPETATNMETFATALSTLNTVCGDNNLTNENLATFGESISTFATCIDDASIVLNDITDEDVENIKKAATAGEALAELNSAIPSSGGKWQEWVGEKNLSEWGTTISAFADSLVAFSSKVSGQTIDTEAITASANAATAIADLNNNIPASGGNWQEWTGEKNLTSWGSTLAGFGEALVDYSNTVTGNTFDKQAIIDSAEAASALTEVNDALPKTGGDWQEWLGEKNLETFGSGLTTFAEGLVAYSDAASQIDDTDIENIKRTATSMDEIKIAVEKIPKTGGTADWFGSRDVGAFGTGITALATGILDCLDAAAACDDVSSLSNLTDAITELELVFAEVPEVNTEYTGNFKTAVGHIKDACTQINTISTAGYDFTGIDSVKTGINSIAGILTDIDVSGLYEKFALLRMTIDQVVTTATNLVGLNGKTYGGVDTLNGALTSLSEANVDGVVSAFSGKAESMTAAVNAIVNALATGLSEGATKVSEEAANVAEAAVTAVEDKADAFGTAADTLISALTTAFSDSYDSVQGSGAALGNSAVLGAASNSSGMYGAGLELGAGLVQGINDKKVAVYWAAYELGQKAVQGEKDGQASNSPSKLTIKAGKWIGEGLVIGMERMGTSVYNAGKGLGANAVGSISKSIRTISDAINTDIDSQPTIRPVLDLSNVRSGASAIGSMFSGTNTIGVNANISAISSMMNSRSQNGANADVVSAIDKLNKKMDNFGNTTYSINGVTYDDGSNIAEAVRTITRAAVRERRV